MIIVSSCCTRSAASKIGSNTIYGNIVSVTVLLTHGIVYLIMLCLLTLLMYLRTDYISSGRIERLFMILKHI